MTPQVRVRHCAPGGDGGAAQLYKLWQRCSGATSQQAAPHHLKDTRPGVSDIIYFAFVQLLHEEVRAEFVT